MYVASHNKGHQSGLLIKKKEKFPWLRMVQLLKHQLQPE